MSTSPAANSAPARTTDARTAIVIGAGFGGLALAIRLQSAGVETTIVEARDKPGGRAYVWEKDGFTFDAGPTVITDPPCLQELWALTGRDMADDVTL
ncbi:MAG: FAD-binding protein, partial [Sphingomonas sp.]